MAAAAGHSPVGCHAVERSLGVRRSCKPLAVLQCKQFSAFFTDDHDDITLPEQCSVSRLTHTRSCSTYPLICYELYEIRTPNTFQRKCSIHSFIPEPVTIRVKASCLRNAIPSVISLLIRTYVRRYMLHTMQLPSM